jgi:hypothetical protein
MVAIIRAIWFQL